MRISVKAKPHSHEDKVLKIDEGNFVVSVKALPEDGKANAAIESALADYLGVAKSRVHVVSGHSSKQKVVEIL